MTKKAGLTREQRETMHEEVLIVIKRADLLTKGVPLANAPVWKKLYSEWVESNTHLVGTAEEVFKVYERRSHKFFQQERRTRDSEISPEVAMQFLETILALTGGLAQALIEGKPYDELSDKHEKTVSVFKLLSILLHRMPDKIKKDPFLTTLQENFDILRSIVQNAEGLEDEDFTGEPS